MNELDMSTIDSMAVEEIDNKRVEALKELEIYQNHCALVEQKYLEIQLSIISKQKEKKETEIALSKAKQNIRTLSTQIKILESKFWKKRGG